MLRKGASLVYLSPWAALQREEIPNKLVAGHAIRDLHRGIGLGRGLPLRKCVPDVAEELRPNGFCDLATRKQDRRLPCPFRPGAPGDVGYREERCPGISSTVVQLQRHFR